PAGRRSARNRRHGDRSCGAHREAGWRGRRVRFHHRPHQPGRTRPFAAEGLQDVCPVRIRGRVVGYKLPVSALVLIHTADLQVLLLERADKSGYWQSVTGSLEEGETPREAAIREVREETGLVATDYRFYDMQASN